MRGGVTGACSPPLGGWPPAARQFSALPVPARLGSLCGMSMRPVMALVGALVLTVAIGTLVFWVLAHGEKTARDTSTRFASALVGTDATPVPKGAAGYVKGVRQVFGPVRAARVIDARNHRTGSGKHGRTYYLTEVLLDTEKGPAVVELEFDSASLTLSNDEVTGVRELFPRDVRDDALSDTEFVALAKAFQRRGGRPANDLELSGTFVRTPDIVKELPQRVRRLVAPVVTPSAQLRDAERRLRCVKRAKGDVEKLAACAR